MDCSILNLLQAGGYLLYVRHGEATVGEDQLNLSFQNCYTQRNLSELGRRQAIYYGQVLRDFFVPIEYPVLASPFCRAIETAYLGFGRSNVLVDPFWTWVYRLSDQRTYAERRNILDAIQSRFEVILPQAGNRVIVAHSFPEGIGLGQIPDMGTVIIKPRGKGNGYEVLAKLSLIELANL